jgi:hypothetical protein
MTMKQEEPVIIATPAALSFHQETRKTGLGNKCNAGVFSLESLSVWPYSPHLGDVLGERPT